MVVLGGGSQVALMVAGATVGPGRFEPSSASELLGTTGDTKRRGVNRVLETQAAPGEPTSQGLASRHE